MESDGLGPAIKGPLYFVLLISAITVSFFLGKYQGAKSPESLTQVFGASDVAASDTFQVSNVAARAKTPRQIGCLYKQFSFIGEITSTGPGKVSYEWEGDNNSQMFPTELVFDSAGTKQVATTWQVYGPGKRQIKLHVYDPNNTFSNEVSYELICE